jgi:phenylalanyl-tRNA synthetase beta chain
MGHPIDDDEIDRILTSLGLEITSPGGNEWNIPSYRLDLERPVDLIEEVARVFGFDPLESRTVARFSPASKPDALYDFTRQLQQRLAGLGFHECRHIKLISDAQLADDVATQHRGMSEVRLKNPLNDEQNIMRPGLIPGLLSTAERNVRMGNTALRLFEIGRVFTATPKGDEIEHEHLGLLITGENASRSWHDPRPADVDLFDLRGALENLAAPHALTLTPVEDPRLLLASQIQIGAQKKLGLIGMLPPARARELGIDAPILVAELNLKKLSAALCTGVTAEPLPRFPAISRDIALEAPADLPNLDIEHFFAAATNDEALLVGAEMFDRFVDPSGEKLDAERKSITWSLTYRSPERTLESAEVDAAHQRILESLKKTLPVEFR